MRRLPKAALQTEQLLASSLVKVQLALVLTLCAVKSVAVEVIRGTPQPETSELIDVKLSALGDRFSPVWHLFAPGLHEKNFCLSAIEC